MKRNEEAEYSLCLHFYFKDLCNCQLNFWSFIFTIEIIFLPYLVVSDVVELLFCCSWRDFRCFWTAQTVPFRLPTCKQFRLCSVLQVVRTCHCEAIIFRNSTYPQSVTRVLENLYIEKARIPPKYECCHKSIPQSKS